MKQISIKSVDKELDKYNPLMVKVYNENSLYDGEVTNPSFLALCKLINSASLSTVMKVENVNVIRSYRVTDAKSKNCTVKLLAVIKSGMCAIFSVMYYDGVARVLRFGSASNLVNTYTGSIKRLTPSGLLNTLKSYLLINAYKALVFCNTDKSLACATVLEVLSNAISVGALFDGQTGIRKYTSISSLNLKREVTYALAIRKGRDRR